MALLDSRAGSFLFVLVAGLVVGIFLRQFKANLSTTTYLKSKDCRAIGDQQSWIGKLRSRLQYVQDGYNMILKAYFENPHSILRVPAEGELLVLPPKYLDELKSLPESRLSSTAAIADYFMGQYTTLDVSHLGPVIWDTIRALNRELGDLVEPLLDECVFAFEKEFPLCQDWTPVTLQPIMLRIVARLNARVFVGFPVCRDPLWIHTSIDHAACIYMGGAYMKLVPNFLRPIAARFMPYIKRIKDHHRDAQRLLIPEIQRRRQQRSEDEKGQSTEYIDMLQLLEEVSTGDDLSPETIVHRQLGLTFAATHGTTNHLVNVVYDLATRWDDYIKELRQEIDDAVREEDGFLRKNTAAKLSQLDSFMKESQRLNPGSALSFNRKCMSPIELSDGNILPTGTYLTMASGGLARSAEYHDSPETFDGFRFHRLRMDSDAANPNAHQFTTTGLGSLMFGHGKYACPGRWFASLESKIILAHILRNYDIRLPDGVRPVRNFVVADANLPVPTQQFLFKLRSC